MIKNILSIIGLGSFVDEFNKLPWYIRIPLAIALAAVVYIGFQAVKLLAKLAWYLVKNISILLFKGVKALVNKMRGKKEPALSSGMQLAADLSKIDEQQKAAKVAKDIAKAAMLLIVMGAVGCSSAPKRTKYSSKEMRVMVDPDSFLEEDQVAIEHALIQSGRYFVVSRNKGYAAAKKEQERQHRDEADRFSDREKYALWSRMYGVGGIIVGHSNCIGFGPVFKGRCKQNLMLVNATTGEYIASAETEAKTGYNGAWGASWEDAVDELNDNSPKTLVKVEYTKELEYDRSVAEEHAVRQKEIVAKAKAKGISPAELINNPSAEGESKPEVKADAKPVEAKPLEAKQ